MHESHGLHIQLLVDAPLEAESYPKTSQSHRRPVLADALRDALFSIRLALSAQLSNTSAILSALHCMFAQAAAWPRRLDADKFGFLSLPEATVDPNRIGAGMILYSSSPDCRVRERKMSRTRMSYIYGPE